jgi:hypothetical protein
MRVQVRLRPHRFFFGLRVSSKPPTQSTRFSFSRRPAQVASCSDQGGAFPTEHPPPIEHTRHIVTFGDCVARCEKCKSLKNPDCIKNFCTGYPRRKPGASPLACRLSINLLARFYLPLLARLRNPHGWNRSLLSEVVQTRLLQLRLSASDPFRTRASRTSVSLSVVRVSTGTSPGGQVCRPATDCLFVRRHQCASFPLRSAKY